MRPVPSPSLPAPWVGDSEDRPVGPLSASGLGGPFAASRLVTGLVGLSAVAPYFAWRGAATSLDVAVALGFAAPFLAAVVAWREALIPVARTVAAAGAALLAVTALAVFGVAAWPVLLLLGAEPLDGWVSGRRPIDVVAAATGLVLGATAFALVSDVPPEAPLAPGQAAIAVLAVGLLVALAMHGRAAVRPDRAESDGASALPLLEAACDLVTWHDLAGDVVRASATAGEFAGASFARGAYLSQVHVSDRPAFLKALSDAANGAGTVATEFRLHVGAPDPDGTPAKGAQVIWVEMRARRLPSPDPRGAVVVAFARDVTAHRNRADEIERARRDAERANELKGRFLATVSHELRTPLNAIIGFSELLSVDHPYLLTEERRKEYSLIIRNSGHHLLEIVNTLLDMSKIETGNFTVVPEPFGFAELAASCCDLMQLKADEASVELSRHLEADLPEILADRRACRQILINLLSNAVKFTPAGGLVKVAVLRGGGDVVLSVADTGIGIPEADLPRLGDPFFQAGEVHKRRHEGTGLGLSVVRGLVGLHGGTVSIESGAGVGTTVTITLPIDGRGEGGLGKPAVVHTLSRRAPRPVERMIA